MDNIIPALEAMLFASGDSVQISRLSLILQCDEEAINAAAAQLAELYIQRNSGIRLRRLNDSLQLCSAPEYSDEVFKILEERKNTGISQPAMEALSVVAYYQPVTRAYIDKIRGVDSSHTVNMLCDKGLIEPCGRLDVPGRPLLYKTGETFLRVMGITSLNELPPLPELCSEESIEILRARIDELKNPVNLQQLTIADINSASADKE